MKEWLNRPYPLLTRSKDKLLLVFGFAIFTYLFLLLYQPFGAADIPGKTWFLAGFGLSVFISLAFNYFVLPRLLNSWFNPEKWQVKKEILYIACSFCLIAFLNYLYNSRAGREIAPQFSLPAFLGITFSVGIFPLLALLFFTERYLNKRNRGIAREMARGKAYAEPALAESKNAWPAGDSRSGAAFTIEGDTQKQEPLSLRLEEFLFAASDNNYTSFYYMQSGVLKRRLLRLSLKNVEKQLTGWDTIVRCHRSYIINKSKVINISGNARSLYVELEHCKEPIPISRSFPREELEA